MYSCYKYTRMCIRKQGSVNLCIVHTIQCTNSSLHFIYHVIVHSIKCSVVDAAATGNVYVSSPNGSGAAAWGSPPTENDKW